MNELSKNVCVACRPNSPKVTEEEITKYLSQIPAWKLIQQDQTPRIQRSFPFKMYLTALDFINQLALLAEEEDHHPSIQFEWGQVSVTWWTYVINGLHRNDFIMAARTDQLYLGFLND